MVQLKHIYKTYHSDKHVLRDLNFEPQKSQFYVVSGPSGSGKTTLFKILSLLSTPTSGEIYIKGKNIKAYSYGDQAKYRQGVGIIFQDYKLIEDINLYENMVLPLRIQKKSDKEIHQKALYYSEVLGLKDILEEFPQFVSGGQQQRVAVARALINDPSLILADEPTGNLDTANTQIILNLLQQKSRSGASVVLATHDENIIKSQLGTSLRLAEGQLQL